MRVSFHIYNILTFLWATLFPFCVLYLHGVYLFPPSGLSLPHSLFSLRLAVFCSPVVLPAPLFIVLLFGSLWAPIAGSLSLSPLSGVWDVVCRHIWLYHGMWASYASYPGPCSCCPRPGIFSSWLLSSVVSFCCCFCLGSCLFAPIPTSCWGLLSVVSGQCWPLLGGLCLYTKTFQPLCVSGFLSVPLPGSCALCSIDLYYKVQLWVIYEGVFSWVPSEQDETPLPAVVRSYVSISIPAFLHPFFFEFISLLSL